MHINIHTELAETRSNSPTLAQIRLNSPKLAQTPANSRLIDIWFVTHTKRLYSHVSAAAHTPTDPVGRDSLIYGT